LELSALREGQLAGTAFIPIRYPGWRRYVEPEFSAESLLSDLLGQVLAAVPSGPVGLLGVSLGGHFCYALALRLQALGRDVAGICVVDSFMVTSSAAGKGWVRRALDDAFYVLRKGRVREFFRQLLGKCWRALLRLAARRLEGWARWYKGVSTGAGAPESLFEFELSLRLLLRTTAPWVASLDRNPVALDAPAALLRTPVTVSDDEAWRRRCPRLEVLEITGSHQTLFESENIDALRAAVARAKAGWQRP